MERDRVRENLSAYPLTLTLSPENHGRERTVQRFLSGWQAAECCPPHVTGISKQYLLDPAGARLVDEGALPVFSESFVGEFHHDVIRFESGIVGVA